MRGLPVFAEAAAAEEELLFAVFCFAFLLFPPVLLLRAVFFRAAAVFEDVLRPDDPRTEADAVFFFAICYPLPLSEKIIGRTDPRLTAAGAFRISCLFPPLRKTADA